jgi:predicted DNA-binding transcriptional regulator YafY
MPATKDQIKRIEVLDELLSARKWRQKELLDRLNAKMDWETEIDKRTLYRDLNYLIQEKNAPLHRPEKGDNFYYYEEKFSVKNIPIDEDDVAALRKAIEILRQVDSFQLLGDVEEVINKLENRIYTRTERPETSVQFEKHTTSLGHEHIEELFDAIQSKSALKLIYQPFFDKPEKSCTVHPYLLKEYRNRWFLLGREGSRDQITIYAVDRIKKIKNTDEPFLPNDFFRPEEYYKNVVGVSVPPDAKPKRIEIKASKDAAPYILSKPIHHSQNTTKKLKDGGVVIELLLIINYELKALLLSYGAGIEIRKPAALRIEMASIIEQMRRRYK